MKKHKTSIRVDRLRSCYTDDVPWSVNEDPWDCGFSWSQLSDVTDANLIERGAHVQNDRNHCNNSDPAWHAARVIYLSKNEEHLEVPIYLIGEQGIEAHMSGIFCPSPVIMDGWHRFFAHIVLGKDLIPCEYEGDKELLLFLHGKVQSRPNRRSVA